MYSYKKAPLAQLSKKLKINRVVIKNSLDGVMSNHFQLQICQHIY